MVSIRLAAGALLCCIAAQAQPAEAKRPKVALVLEGGAALGFAHVGVLEWMEENRIPVDMIAGASMGGLIGGLYAAGHTPKEIRAIARDADWDKYLSGLTSFSELSYRRKEDKQAFPNRLELGIRKGVTLPAGFNDGHQIGLLFSRQTLGYPVLKSFDELPTPFRCVSADLVSGTTKVWESGYLGEALRSTMSIPALFSPVVKGKGVYVDGGLLNNLPVDVAKQMGADITIAVHLSKGPVDPKSIASVLDVMARSVSVVVGAAEMRTIATADIVLVADLQAFSTSEYQRSEEIIAIGAKAAEAKASMLRRFSVDEETWRLYQQRRLALTRKPPADPKFVTVSGADKDTNAAMADKLQQIVDDKEGLDSIDRELTQIVGLGRYSTMRYQSAEKDGQQGYEVVAERRPGGPIIVNPAVEINGVDSSNTRFSIGARLTWLDFWGYRSEWRNDLWFGSRFAALTEIYKPIRRNSRFFIAPRAYVDSNPFDLYLDGKVLSEYRFRQQGAGVDGGVLLNRFAELRLGYVFNWIEAKQRVGPPILEAISVRRDAVSMRFNYEGQDDAVVPRRGIRVNARAEYYPNKQNEVSGYSLGEFRIQKLTPFTKYDSLITTLSGGVTVGPLRSAFLNYSLGGTQRLGSYGVNEILAENYGLGTIGVLHELKGESSPFGTKVYLTGFVQGARIRDINNRLVYPVNATGAVVLKTLIGPVFVGGSVGDRGHRRWYFGLGRFF